MDGSDPGVGFDEAPESDPGREQIGVQDGRGEIGLQASAETVARIVPCCVDSRVKRRVHSGADIGIGGQDQRVHAVKIMSEQAGGHAGIGAYGANRGADHAFLRQAPGGGVDQCLSPDIRRFPYETGPFPHDGRSLVHLHLHPPPGRRFDG